eukprot:10312976-Alexandrium_andersonii.AAC.1
MSGGVPEGPPGLDQRGPKRSRSAGAVPTTRTSSTSRTSPTSPTASSTPIAFGPSDPVGVGRRASE